MFSVGTILSRVVGLLREVVLANIFGAGISMDAFLVANRIPNMLREMLAEGALGSSFTKVYSAAFEKNPEKAARLYDTCLMAVGLLSLIIALIGFFGAPFFVSALTLFSEPKKVHLYAEAVKLTRILFPFIGFMALGSIAMGVLHQRGKFFLTSSSSMLLNFGYILGAVAFSSGFSFSYAGTSYLPDDPRIFALAIGVLLGGFLQALVQIIGAYTLIRHFPGFSLSNIKESLLSLTSIFYLMVPMIVASSAAQINVFINTNFATSLEDGAVTWLSFAFRLVQLPVGIFAVAIGSVILPSLTRSIHKACGKKSQETSNLLFGGIRWVSLTTFAFAIFYICSNYEICHLLYEHGKFTNFDTQMTARAMCAYSLGLLGYALIKVLTAFYYAQGRTKFAMYASLIGIGINFVANLIFVDAFGFEGIALTSSLVLMLNALLLFWGIRKEVIFENSGLGSLALTLFLASMSVFFIKYALLLPGFHLLANLDPKVSSFIKISLYAGIVAIAFLGFYRLIIGPFQIKSRLTLKKEG